MIYQIMLPGKIRFGVGSLDTLGDEATKLAAKQVLIVTDPGVYQAGLADSVKERLSKAKLSVDIFSEAEPEPTFPRLNAAAEQFGKESYDLLVGVGGGSSMDTAKGLSILLAHGGKGQDYGGVDKVPGSGIPIFTLPTTAGTGSEVTKIAIFGDPEKGRKLGIVSPYLFARLALVDPTLTYRCPPKVTAASGIDALTHAIECYTGNKANTFSDALAVEAIRLIVGNLRTAVKNGSDKEARNRMSEGALIAGIAFGNSGVAAVHALAYPLGSRFHVPHGVANGLLLPYVMECNLSGNLPKYATVAQMLGVEMEGLSLQEAAQKGVEAAKALADDIGIPLHLRDLGVPKEALEEMAVATMDVTRLLGNNPKELTLDDVRRIWQNAW
ncbi:MAG: iron-containing alcohol dehydrogenase [Dehalococcoidia bacterium]|nr:MAG: iron-containing alcohol dehydrogenase [Dehalococcoidia bacterium]